MVTARDVLLALLLAGCGAAPAPDDLILASAPAVGLPPAALAIPPASASLRALAAPRPGPLVIEDATDQRLYEVLVTLDGPRAISLGAEARAEWLAEPLTAEPGEVAPCAGAPCGQATLPVGAPLEAAWWLALADLHWHQDATVQRAMSREADVGEVRATAASRHLLRFNAGPDVRCASQQKLFDEAVAAPAQPVDPLVRKARAEQGIAEAELPRAEADALRGQLLLRQRQREDGRYAVEVHLGLDAEAAAHAEVFDAVLVCDSAQPLHAGRLPGYDQRLARGDDGQWRVAVFSR
ncbi:MAG: hypothetical protein KC620_15130 [Myxococcales bacterium]|nr:hypothetical protein [Myxococcales bacterium]